LFDFLRRNANPKDINLRDELGEWLVISKNPEMSFLYWLVQSTLKKAGSRKFDAYIVEFYKDDKIKNFVSCKTLVVSRQNVREQDISKYLGKVSEDFGLLGETKVSKLRLCGELFIFIYFDLVLRKVKNHRNPVKLLLPPLGVRASEIPYTPEELFSEMLSNLTTSNCVADFEIQDAKHARIIANCDNPPQYESLKYAMAYFSDPLEVKVNAKRSGPMKNEVEIDVYNFRTKALIPLIWENFMHTYVQC
jgi:hypothetical protein